MFPRARAMRHRPHALAFALTLTLASLLGSGLVPALPGAQASQAFGPVQVDGAHTAACPRGAATTIQDAVDCALPGATIYVSPGTYDENIVVATPDLTLCSHIGGPLCAVDVETAHWSKSASGTWDAAPDTAHGQAIRFEGIGSTSLFPPAGLILDEVFALSFDLFAGTACGAGSPRFAFGIDVTGDGVRDGNVYTYNDGSYSCTPGTWLHVDFIDDPTAHWASGVFGGPNRGTAAQAQSAIDTAAAANGQTARIVAINVQIDHAPATTTWIDNVRVDNWLLAEPADELCFFDPTGATCRHQGAVADTVIRSSGGNSVTILASGVTIRGFTVRAASLSEANGIYVGTSSGPSFNDVSILDNHVVTTGLGESGITGRFQNGLIQDNTVQGFRQGIYLRTHDKSVTVQDNTLANNGEGILTYGFSPHIEGNTIRDSLVRAIGIGNINADPANSIPVLRHNVFRGPAPTLGFREVVSDMHVDARYNDWGTYSRSSIEDSMESMTNGNTVDTRCYTNAARTGFSCPPTAADFTTAPGTLHWRTPVTFTDASDGTTTIVERSWSFGDGATATGATVAHTYGASGPFEVTYTIRDQDGYEANTTRTITTTNAAPGLAPIPDRTGDAGSLLSFTVPASDPNGDPLTSQPLNLPDGAMVSGPATARTFSWQPTTAQVGNHTLVWRVSDGDLAVTQPVTIRVTGAGATTGQLTLERVGALVHRASPGEVETFEVLVRNDGSQTETISFSPSGLAVWDTAMPAPVTLAPGAAAPVTFTAIVPGGMPSGSVGMVATGATTGAAAATQYLVRVPVVVQVALDDPSTLGAVTGTVTARFLDGAPVDGAAVTVRQTPSAAAMLASSDAGTTDGNGTHAFSLTDPGAALPGTHVLDATVTWAGQGWTRTTTYTPTL